MRAGNCCNIIGKSIGLVVIATVVTACGGGGSGSGDGSAIATEAAVEQPAGENTSKLDYQSDIEPIVQRTCIGCHGDSASRVAPFSLVGEDALHGLRSAVLLSLQNKTMPPTGGAQLTANEYAKLVAWLRDEPYIPVPTRVSLVNANAWDVQTRIRDSIPGHRPVAVDCPRDWGWLVEGDALEVRTERCNYLSLTQQSLLQLEAATELEISFSHSELNFNAPSTAHIAVLIGGNVLLDKSINIPSDANIYKERISLGAPVSFGDEIVVHLHNHGANAWTLHSIDAFILGELSDANICPTYNSTFEAIQATVFEATGCANSLCHGDAAAGGLDLRPHLAYSNLLDVPSTSSEHPRLKPKKPNESFLYQKLAEKVFPGTYNIAGSPMPSAGAAISAGQLEAIRWWIEAGAPETGSVGDFVGRGENEIERLLGVCLPEPEPIGVEPLLPPAVDKGVQMRMPPHRIDGEQERELCFATYYDFRDQVPEQYLTQDRDRIYVGGGETREDPFTHHNVLTFPNINEGQINDPAYGVWSCSVDSGELADEACDPLKPAGVRQRFMP